jgi:plastocyanin
MSKKRLGFLTTVLAVLAIGSILLAACARPGSATASSSTTPSSGNSGGSGGSGTTVHMGPTNFLVSTTTIPKGSMLTLIDDAAVPHIIQNGSWDASGTAKPAKEAGAPTVNQSFTGSDTHTIGPFTTAGTFHVYCTIHSNMNLTITVK